MIREILSFIDDAETGTAHVRALLGLAERFDAQLELGVLTADPMMFPELAPYTGLYLPEIVLAAMARRNWAASAPWSAQRPIAPTSGVSMTASAGSPPMSATVARSPT